MAVVVRKLWLQLSGSYVCSCQVVMVVVIRKLCLQLSGSYGCSYPEVMTVVVRNLQLQLSRIHRGYCQVVLAVAVRRLCLWLSESYSCSCKEDTFYFLHPLKFLLTITSSTRPSYSFFTPSTLTMPHPHSLTHGRKTWIETLNLS